MTKRSLFLEQLIEKEAFILCPPLETSDFLSYCEKRGLKISKERLEKFEKLGIFMPVARVQRPKINDTLDDRYANFEWWVKGLPKEWFEKGLLWEPLSRDFQEWKTFEDEERIEFIKSYYSIFQIHSLYHILQSLTIPFQAEELEFYSIEALQPMINHWAEWTKRTIKSIKENQPHSIWNSAQQASILCQVIANRFFLLTQTDKRTMKRGYYPYENWDWREYCKSWDANIITEELGLTIQDVKEIHERLLIDAKNIDPVEDWYDLVGFISVEKKGRLKDKALLAQSVYAMEHMVRLFYEALTSEKLPFPNETRVGELNQRYGIDVSDDYLQYLEFLANEYHLNPKPKLILVVEGHGEEPEIPRLAKKIGYSFSKNGIEIINIQGVNNFTGKQGRYNNSNLEKFIDYHHNRQTIVFLLFDNEGGIEKTIKNLLNIESKYSKGFSVTKSEYIHLWPKAIELDNFNDKEIAQAMTKVSTNKNIYTFSVADVQHFRICGKNNNLTTLYEEKLGNDNLPKTELLQILFDYAIENPKIEIDGIVKDRPIIDVLLKIRNLVFINHLPINAMRQQLNRKEVRGKK